MVNKLFITPFPVEIIDGGGYVTREVIENLKPEQLVTRRTGRCIKVLNSIFGFLLLPFIHPIFSRFIPISIISKNKKNSIIFNFSQTFGGIIFSRYSIAICHDLQCHNCFIFNRWVRWSEAFLLRRAQKIYTLSYRDAKILRRLYGISQDKLSLINIFQEKNIKEIHKFIPANVNKLIFLGNMRRRENLEAVKWFSNEVMPNFPYLYLDVIGDMPISYDSFHPNIRWLGRVTDLSKAFNRYELMIAPMFSKAGVKIKVFEALQFGLPVLGTINAFSGLARPEQGFCSNSPQEWSEFLRNGGVFKYKGSSKERC